MPLAALLGLGPEPLANIFGFSPKVRPENTVIIGVRDIDATEKENIQRAGVTEVYTMRDIDERGMRTVMEEALRAASKGTAGYHVSLDMDWIDPEDAPGVGTPVRGGATYREAHLAMEIIADNGGMLSFEIVEVNPVIDERNRTADLAVELIASAFGKKISLGLASTSSSVQFLTLDEADVGSTVLGIHEDDVLGSRRGVSTENMTKGSSIISGVPWTVPRLKKSNSPGPSSKGSPFSTTKRARPEMTRRYSSQVA